MGKMGYTMFVHKNSDISRLISGMSSLGDVAVPTELDAELDNVTKADSCPVSIEAPCLQATMTTQFIRNIKIVTPAL